MKGLIICAGLLVAAIMMTGTGIFLLVARYQMEAPQEYQDASINYRPRLAESHIKATVAKDDVDIVAARMTGFIGRNGGEVTDVWEGIGRTVIRARGPSGMVEQIATLANPAHTLSPGYRDWPQEERATREGELQEVAVTIRGIPYRRLMLRLGLATTIGGAICTLIGAATLGGMTMARLNRQASEALDEEEGPQIGS